MTTIAHMTAQEIEALISSYPVWQQAEIALSQLIAVLHLELAPGATEAWLRRSSRDQKLRLAADFRGGLRRGLKGREALVAIGAGIEVGDFRLIPAPCPPAAGVGE